MTDIRTFTFNVTAQPTSVLQAAAQNLAAGSAVLFTTGGLEPDSQGELYWQHHWFFANGYGHLLLKDAGGGNLKYQRYTEATHTWAKLYDGQPPSNVGRLGHVWGGFAFDPATNRLWWFNDRNDNLPRNLLVWNANISNWDIEFTPTDVQSGSVGAAERTGFTWHPSLDGGSWVWNSYGRIYTRSSAGVQTMRLNTGSAIGGRYGVGVYRSAEDDVVFFDGEPSAQCWRVTNAGSVVALPSTPVRVGAYNTTSNALAVYVNNRLLILERPGPSARVWMLNAGQTAWELQAFTHPFWGDISTADNGITANFVDPDNGPISITTAYGCVWAAGNGPLNQTTRTALWKPPV